MGVRWLIGGVGGGVRERRPSDSTENRQGGREDKFLASVDSELWALLSAREQQAASLHVGIIDGGPPRWLSKCATVRAIFQPSLCRALFASCCFLASLGVCFLPDIDITGTRAHAYATSVLPFSKFSFLFSRAEGEARSVFSRVLTRETLVIVAVAVRYASWTLF